MECVNGIDWFVFTCRIRCATITARRRRRGVIPCIIYYFAKNVLTRRCHRGIAHHEIAVLCSMCNVRNKTHSSVIFDIWPRDRLRGRFQLTRLCITNIYVYHDVIRCFYMLRRRNVALCDPVNQCFLFLHFHLSFNLIDAMPCTFSPLSHRLQFFSLLLLRA